MRQILDWQAVGIGFFLVARLARENKVGYAVRPAARTGDDVIQGWVVRIGGFDSAANVTNRGKSFAAVVAHPSIL
jgi:hypothetical protein